MIRPLLSLKRLSFSEKEGQVNYQYAAVLVVLIDDLPFVQEKSSQNMVIRAK